MPFDPRDPDNSLGLWSGVATQNYHTRVLQALRRRDLEKWFSVLVLIHEADGALSQQELAKALLLDKVAVTHAVDHLNAKGYVQRMACPKDRCKRHLRTLPKASAVVKNIRAAFHTVKKLAFAGKNAAERKRFRSDLARINANLAQPEGKLMHVTHRKRAPR